jgi:hypothetical protein
MSKDIIKKLINKIIRKKKLTTNVGCVSPQHMKRPIRKTFRPTF